jgi:hypothetical protein
MANSRTAHYNRDNLLDLESQVDNFGNSGANTCLDAPTCTERVQLLDQNQTGLLVFC